MDLLIAAHAFTAVPELPRAELGSKLKPPNRHASLLWVCGPGPLLTWCYSVILKVCLGGCSSGRQEFSVSP